MTGPAEPHDDVVRLELPAATQHLRLARLAAASLATDLGFGLGAIEDLRVAVDELCAAVIEEAPAGARLTLTYCPAGDHLLVDGEVDVPLGVPLELHPVAREVLAIVADDYRIGQQGERRSFHLLKRADPGGGHR